MRTDLKFERTREHCLIVGNHFKLCLRYFKVIFVNCHPAVVDVNSLFRQKAVLRLWSYTSGVTKTL